MKIRTVVRMLRARHFSSAADLAQRAQIDILRYKRFEAAVRYYHLRHDEVLRLAAVLGYPPSELASDDGSPKLLGGD